MSLKYSIAATIFILQSLLMSLVLWQTLSMARRDMERQHQSTEGVALSLLSGLAVDAFDTNEFRQLQDQIDGVVKNRSVDAVIVLNAGGKVLASAPTEFAGRSVSFLDARDSGASHWHQEAVMDASGNRGRIAVKFSKVEMLAAVGSIRNTAIVLSAVMIALIAGVSLWTGYLLTRRLNALSAAADHAMAGDSFEKLVVGRRDEVAVLARSFSSLAKRYQRTVDELTESHARFKDFIDSSVDSYWEMNEDLKFTWVSNVDTPNAAILESSIIGKTRWELASADPDKDSIWYGHRAVLQARRPFRDFRFSLLDENDHERFLRVSGRPIFGLDGAFKGYRGTTTDETVEHEQRWRAQRLLLESKRKYQDLYDKAPLMYGSVDARTQRLVECNQTLVDITGYDKEELLELDFRSLYTTDCRQHSEKVFRQFLATGNVRDADLQIRCKDGSVIDVVLNSSAIRDEMGEIVRSRSIWRDVTAQKRASRALLDSERRFMDFADVATDWYWETGPDLRFTYVSPRLSEVVGLDAKDLAGKLREEMPGITVDQRLWRQHVRDLKARRPFKNLTFSLRDPDGGLRTFSSSGKPCFDEQENFLGYRGVATDTTAEREAEAKRHEAETRLASAIELIPAALSLYDSDDRLVLCNGADREIFEASNSSHLGTSFRDLVTAVAEGGNLRGSRRDVEEWLARRLDRRINPCRGFSYRLSDGRWMEVDDYILEDGDLLSVCVDITERKNAEQALRAHEAELAQVLRRSTLDQMSAIMAHELNQPLTAVVNFSNGCLRRLRAGDRDFEQYIQILEEMRDQATRASAILKRVGGFVGQSSPEAVVLEIPDIVQSVKLLLNAELAQNHVKLDLKIASGLPCILGERVGLEQVLFNLIKNAIEATLDRSLGERWVRVTLDHADKDMIAISVRDSGLGFPAEMEASAFEPFMSSKPDGMGMGLSICRTIVEAQGGAIWVETGSVEGGLVRLTLPSVREYKENVA